jgi:phosphoribosylglycinamide formyltransferase-1
MYGHHVHQAVIENKEPVSGISVHYVNKEYDRGDIIFQVTCPVMPGDTPDSLAERVHELEYRHFPEVIEKVILTSTHS